MSKQMSIEHLVKFPEILGELKTTSSQDLITLNEINQVNKMSKQTAVEYLQERLFLSLSDELKCLNGFFVIAKEMEKEQITEAFKEGNLNNGWLLKHEMKQYYNQTYKKEEK